MLTKQITANRAAVQAGMQIVYWLAESEVALFTKFESLKELCIDLGAEVLRDLEKGKNSKYSSNRIIDEWLHVIASIIREDVKEDLRKCLNMGLMCDESTDVSVTKQLIVFARVVTSNHGVSYRYLQTLEMSDGRAETIERALLACLQEYGIGINKVAGFGSDGANVMVGCRGDVATRLKKSNPLMLAIHCINHRLALSAAQSIESVPYLKKFNEILVGIFKLYHYSSVRQAALKEIQSIYEDPILKFKEPKSVRWLSHRNAVNAVRRCLISLIFSLEREASERGDPCALGLATLVKNHIFVATLLFMSDVLAQLDKLSLVFQEREIDLSRVQPLITSCIRAIEGMKDVPGPALQSLQTVLEELANNDIVVVTGENADTHFHDNIQVKYCEALVSNLQNRFPDLPVISAFSVFDPALLTSDPTCGYDKLETLCNHYKFDVIECKQEWIGFREMIRENNMACTTIMNELLKSSYSLAYPLLAELASCTLSLPVSNAECERGFSALKRTKTTLRNRLSTKSLDAILHITLNGPGRHNFNFQRAIDKWGKLMNRRLTVTVTPSSSTSTEC